MKTMRKLIPVLFTILMMLAVSCAKQTPVTEYVKLFEEISAQIDKASSKDEVYDVMTSKQSEWIAKAEQLVADNSDYQLTDEDRQMLKDSMKSYLEVMTKKSLELAGQKPEGVEETVNTMLDVYVYPSIDAAKTLGDFSTTRAINSSAGQ